MITQLADNEVFVFGSNREGRHGKGAAKYAMRWGAKYGKYEGLMGKTYAIPTKLTPYISLSLNEIKERVELHEKFL